MGTYIIYDISTGENAHNDLAKYYKVKVPKFFCSRQDAQHFIDELNLPFWKYSIALSFEYINPNYGMED